MEIILKEDIAGVGKAGSLVKTKDGFARNYLIPKGLALPATCANLKILQQAKERRALEAEKAKKAAEELAERLQGLSLTIPVLVQENDKLYGSVTSADVAQALKEEGFSIDKEAVLLDEPMKSLGIYEVPVKLHTEIVTQIKVWIVKK